MAAKIVVTLAGLFLVGVALRDVFQAVIVPRAVNYRFRIASLVVRSLWWLWPRVAYRIYANDEDRREDLLGTFAPFALIALLASWVASLVIGFGVIFYGLRDQVHPAITSLGEAIYFAGTSVLTLGYGDFVSHSGFARFFALFAGASGFSVVAVVTSFLFSVFGSFQRREAFVVEIGARAGAPPSGVGLLAVHGKASMESDLDRVFVEGQTWTAQVMESHLAYPILSYFRSSHDYESWIGTLGTLLDAAVLIMTSVCDVPSGQARIMYNIGRHLTHDFSHYYTLPKQYRTSDGPGIERHEFESACDKLQTVGYCLVDRDEAWHKFAALRSTYANELNGLARWFESPPIQWIGDRSLISVDHVRNQLPLETLQKL